MKKTLQFYDREFGWVITDDGRPVVCEHIGKVRDNQGDTKFLCKITGEECIAQHWKKYGDAETGLTPVRNVHTMEAILLCDDFKADDITADTPVEFVPVPEIRDEILYHQMSRFHILSPNVTRKELMAHAERMEKAGSRK